jgi:hypothetical protein
MTEAEWLACTDPRLLLVFLEGQASDRKARLFACGLARSLWPYLGDERSRQVVEIAEKYADNLATKAELAAAREAALDANRGAASRTVSWVGDRWPWQAARMIVASVRQVQMDRAAKDWSGMLIGRSRSLSHCIFANPFRPSPLIKPAVLGWNGGTVVHLAQAVYDERAFDRLPILADALEDAGCHDAGILAHCRGPEPHVRGCWVLDLLLGKT